MGPLRAVVILSLFGLLVLCLAPLQALFLALGLKRPARLLPVLFHQILTRRLFGMRVETHGRPYRRGPVLFVSNHTSWIDILVIGSLFPLSFVAKADVAGWPLFGQLAKLQRTIFVEREKRSKVAEQAVEILNRLKDRDNLVLFAEGTSNDGNRVLKFNPSLLSVAELARFDEELAETMVIQPMSIAYTRLNGIPMGRQFRPFYAWYGDMELGPHLWQGLAMGAIDVSITWHDPIPLSQIGNRKQLARNCQTAIARSVAGAITGRDQDSLTEDLNDDNKKAA